MVCLDSFFMVGGEGLSKMSVKKLKKKNWLKRRKAVPQGPIYK